MILSCNNISKSFGTTTILDHVSFHINEREKAAIVGMNGAGKSTLFKIIMGELSADEGEVVFAKGCSIGYLAQHQELAGDRSIYEEILSTKADVIRMEEQIRLLEREMKLVEGAELEQKLNAYTRLTHSFELLNGYAYKSEVLGILKGLGFVEEDYGRMVATLSGGQKTRVALGKLLLSRPDLILLDEPTNHLDMESIAWLETFLLNYSGAVVVIAHDRYFLNKVVHKVVELEHAKATVFEGNYSDYAVKKAQLRETLIRHYYNQQKEIKHQEEVITKLRSFNREKSIKRAESREKMLDKIERIEKPLSLHAEMNICLEPNIMSGNDVLTVEGLKKTFSHLCLFDHLNFSIKRGERIAIIGNNGTGKTTILKIINEKLAPDEGKIKLGAKVFIGYYDQEHHVLNMDKTIFDEIQDTYPYLDNVKVRNVLASFLFTGDDVFKLIRDISGGERGRVSLAKLMLSDANFLVLDEPTNHLDMVSKEILEDAIKQYTGTVLYVSHDRYFINQTATRILDLTNGQLINYLGNYDYYLEKKPVQDPVSLKLTSQTTGKEAAADYESEQKLDWKQQKEEQARLRKRQNDLKKIEDEIHSLEKRDDEINLELTKDNVFTNPVRLLELNNEKKSVEARIEELMEQWEELAE